ncbi:hypothetical protein ACFJIV_28990 [Mucilaginibacter sp. UC70_90]
MTPQPFTAAGMELKLAELYSLPDPDLFQQANMVATDFRAWVSENFILDNAQNTYLFGLDERYTSYTGQIAKTAIESRLPIILTNNPPSIWSSKFIRSDNHLIVSGNGTGSFTATGSVGITVVYS